MSAELDLDAEDATEIDPDCLEPIGLPGLIPLTQVLDLPAECPRPIRTGPPPRPIEDSNVVRLFRWPAGSGMWYAMVGREHEPGALLYGPMRTPYQTLTYLGRYLKRRKHQFDSMYDPRQPIQGQAAERDTGETLCPTR